MNDTDRLRFAGRLRVVSLCLSVFVILLINSVWWYPLDYLKVYHPDTMQMLLVYPALLGLLIGACAVAIIRQAPSFSSAKLWAIFTACFALVLLGYLSMNSPRSARDHAYSTLCCSYQRAMAQALMMYAEDHHGKAPHSLTDNSFKTCLTDMIGDANKFLECPALPGRIGFGYNRNAQDAYLTVISHPTTFVLTADGGNAQHLLTSQSDIAETRHDLPPPEFDRRLRNPRGFAVSFVDGHVEYLHAGTVVSLNP